MMHASTQTDPVTLFVQHGSGAMVSDDTACLDVTTLRAMIDEQLTATAKLFAMEIRDDTDTKMIETEEKVRKTDRWSGDRLGVRKTD